MDPNGRGGREADVTGSGRKRTVCFQARGGIARLSCRLARHILNIAADQVLAKISPNVSVWAVDPGGDPLDRFIRSLEGLATTIPEDVLVLPGHNLPFFGLQQRIEELIAHHEGRCREIAESCATVPRSTAEIVPMIFHRPLDPHQMGFAFSEVLAHVNYMLRRKELLPVHDGSGIHKVIAARHASD